MSRTSALYRPLTPITPTHSPHASIASSRSRTPGQLSLHEYRKQQRQEVPVQKEAIVPLVSSRRIKRKVAALSLLHGPSNSSVGLPTAPPTPMEFDFQFEDEESKAKEEEQEVDEEQLIEQFLSGSNRRGGNRKGKEPSSYRREPIREGTSHSSRSIGTPRMRAYKSMSMSSSLASTTSLSSVNLPIMARPPYRSELSPPPSPSTPLLPPDLPSDKSPPGLSKVNAAAKKTHFKFNPIKRLPHPAQSLPPLQPARPSMSPASAPATNSTYSPFSMGNYSFPDPPIIRPGSNPVLTRSTDDLLELSPKVFPRTTADVSFTDLLHLYGTSFEMLNRHESLESLNIVPSLSEPSSSNLAALPVFAPKQKLPKMHGYVSDPFGSAISLDRYADDSDDVNIHHSLGPPTRESYYPPEFDSRSIMSTPATPGMKQGIVDYSADLVDPLEESYTPAINQVFDQYGRISGENILPLPHRSVGRAPVNPPPPLPANPIPHLKLPIEHSDSPSGTTDYGATQQLLREYSSTPGVEVSRRAPPTTMHFQDETGVAPGRSKLRASSILSDGLSDSQSIANSTSDWLTTAHNSSNDLSNLESMGESFPFGRPDIPALLTNHQRRIITLSQMPEVPSPHSTVPESHQSLRGTSPTPGGIGDDASFSTSMSSIPPLNIRHDQEVSSLPVGSSEYSEQTSQGKETKNPGSSDSSRVQHRRNKGTQGHYAHLTDRIEEDDEIDTPRHYKDAGMVDPALLSPDPNDDFDTGSSGSDRRLSRWGTLSSPDRVFHNNELRRSLTSPTVPKNHRISFFDPNSGRISVGVAGQNKLMDFSIEMQHISGPSRAASNRSSRAAEMLLDPIDFSQETAQLHLDTNISQVSATTQPVRVSPLTRLRDAFFPARKPLSSMNTSLDNSIPLPQHTYSGQYNRPASSARSSLQPLVPRPMPVVDRNRRLAHAWKPLRMRPRDTQSPSISPRDQMSFRMSPPPVSPKGRDHRRQSSRFAAATYPCNASEPSIDVEAAQPLEMASPASSEYLVMQREMIALQRKWSRIYLFISVPLPFMCALYALGMFDVFMQIHVPSRPRTLERHRRWAWNIAWIELVGILVGLTVWGVQRQGV